MAIRHAKWYVNVGRWNPTQKEWLHLIHSVAEEEITRLNKFVYQEDAKSSLIGRALIRKFVSEVTRIPSNQLIFSRTEYGRPIVSDSYAKQHKSWPKIIDFNVSHSGNHCVLAGVWSDDNDLNLTVGVDVTKIVSKKTKQELDRFLDLMSRREFTKSEWDTVELACDDNQKCINFTRLWCLKECFIKSIGLGLSFKLNRISFFPEEILKYTTTIEMLRNKIIDDTKVLLDGQATSDWYFQETALDDEHLVAIGYNFTENSTTINNLKSDFFDKSPFVEISINTLIEDLNPITQFRESNWVKFLSNQVKTTASG